MPEVEPPSSRDELVRQLGQRLLDSTKATNLYASSLFSMAHTAIGTVTRQRDEFEFELNAASTLTSATAYGMASEPALALPAVAQQVFMMTNTSPSAMRYPSRNVHGSSTDRGVDDPLSGVISCHIDYRIVRPETYKIWRGCPAAGILASA